MDLRSKFTENFNKILAASSHSQADLARYMGGSYGNNNNNRLEKRPYRT